MKTSPNILIVSGLCVAFVATVIGAFLITGSPMKERLRKLDQQRVNDLQQITYAVDTYVNQKHQLPSDLKTLSTSKDVYLGSIMDPVTKTEYAFSAVSSTSYKLCATFDTNATTTENNTNAIPNFWSHPSGEKCYVVDVVDRSKDVMVPTKF